MKAVPYATTQVPPFKAPGDAVEWDVTELVRSLAAGADHGMMVALSAKAAANKSFASRQHLDPAMRPELRLTLVIEAHRLRDYKPDLWDTTHVESRYN